MSDSQTPQEFEVFRREVQTKNVQLLKEQLISERPWFMRIVPQFSLMTLLLLVMLFGLGAAYISLKRSSGVVEKEKDEEIRFLQALGNADRGFLTNRLNMTGMPAIDSLAIIQRFTWRPLEYPQLLLQLDPAKNYAIHARQTDVTAGYYHDPDKSIVIKAVGPRERNRSIVILRFAGSQENKKDSDAIFQGGLHCVVEFHPLYSQQYVRYERNEVSFLRIGPVDIKKSKEVEHFYQLWCPRQFLIPNKPTELFRAVDSTVPLEKPNGLVLWIEEIEPQAIPTLPNRVLFPSNEAN